MIRAEGAFNSEMTPNLLSLPGLSSMGYHSTGSHTLAPGPRHWLTTTRLAKSA